MDSRAQEGSKIVSLNSTDNELRARAESRARIESVPQSLVHHGISSNDIRQCLEILASTKGQTTRGFRPFPHPFPARMPLDLARLAIQRLSSTNALVLDPMVGGGTTTRAAIELGRRALGFDLDPLV